MQEGQPILDHDTPQSLQKKSEPGSLRLALDVLKHAPNRQRLYAESVKGKLEKGTTQERQDALASVRLRLIEVFGIEKMPSLSESISQKVGLYQPEIGLFARKQQGLHSDHDILHHNIVNALDFLVLAYLSKTGVLKEIRDTNRLTEDGDLDVILGVAGGLHDVKRLHDVSESWPYDKMIQHANLAADDAHSLVDQWGSLPDEERAIANKHIDTVGTIIRFHDAETKVPDSLKKIVGIMVFSDRMTLSRLYTSRYWLARLTAPGITQERGNKFQSAIPELRDPKIIRLFGDVAMVLEVLAKEHMNGKYMPESHREAIASSLKQLFGSVTHSTVTPPEHSSELLSVS